MVTHMKTTIDIADALLIEAKQAAAARGETLRELVEEGLRLRLGRLREAQEGYHVTLFTKGGGMTPEGAAKSMHEHILDTYEDRGA